MAVKQTAGRDNLGSLAPKFAELNDDVLFGEVWSREDKLSARDRSMVTIAALFSAGLYPQLKTHIALGKAHGITKEEIVEAVTQLAFYCGWPKAWSTFPMIAEIYGDEKIPENDEKSRYQNTIMFPVGEPNDAFAEYFDGQSYLAPISKEQLFIANVTFEPGCRNHYHIHRAKSGGGQLLIGVGGRGWYREEGKEAVEILPGTVINIPANVKHWHGAAADCWFSHLAVEISGEETSTEWCEAVSAEEYGKLR
ncbi:MAG: carboxymuconolactone decarboxylase family protein [Eubacterium sp.]|nr:carboxymuconolactone decarboxylase family protein [Eubacterium sp.]